MVKIQVEVFNNMRLYNTYYICKQCIGVISDCSIQATRQEMEYRIDNWKDVREALFTVRQIDIFSKDIEKLYEEIPVFVREQPCPRIDKKSKDNLLFGLKSIISKMKVIVDLYESMNNSDTEKGIDVKIPQCESLGEYISYLKEIDFIFTQCPFLQRDGGMIQFKTVDVGSQWLSFIIVGASGAAAMTAILTNLATLVDKAVQIRSHILNLKQQEEILRAKKNQNDFLESSREVFQALEQHYYSEAIKDMEEKNEDIPLKDGEERGKLEKSLEKLCNLMDKGVEIYASIDTSNEIQVLFPPLQDKAELPDSIIRYIEDKEKADSGEGQEEAP